MFYHLFLELSDQISALNVFRYITFRTGGALMTALFLVFMFGPWLISQMRLKQGKGQPIREDGPARHVLEKQGTPTMGGLMILVSVLISTMLWADLSNLYVWSVLFVTMGFGAIGFYVFLFGDGLLKESKVFFVVKGDADSHLTIHEHPPPCAGDPLPPSNSAS